MRGLLDTTDDDRTVAHQLLAALVARSTPLLATLPQLSRYSLASVCALALDFTIYLMLTDVGVRASFAGVVGYGLGLALHYHLSTRFVFDATATAKAPARLFGEFALSGMAGMAVTALVITVASDAMGLAALPAKVLAAGCSFIVVFTLRRAVVFARHTASSG